ncbi:MAG: DnaJ like chaperone protein [Sulfitobacter sp.]|jgi:DnaJ like chaperone protein
MIAGKIIAGLIGLSVAGPIGVLIGVYIGHQFDKGLGGLRPMSAEQQAEVRESFFETVFGLLGHLAKADGRVSEVEVAHAEALMAKMGLNTPHRKQAIELFKAGSQGGFSIDASMDRFMATCGKQNNLKRALLDYLVSLAIADGELHQAEQAVLRKIAGRLGFSPALFDKFIEMVKAQSQFNHSGGGGFSESTSPGKLQAAYTALGVEAAQSDTQIKRAYRKLISANHPDKLIGQGMPDDMVKLATERTQEIQTAYELVVASRK